MSLTSQIFDPNGEYKFDLITASSLGDLSLVENILRNNFADVNGVNSTGWTPLMYASHYGHYNVIRMLIKYKCNVNYQDQTQGRTALMLAASNGHTRTIATLLNCGKADKNLTDFMGHDAIHYAKTCGHGNNKMIKSLLGKERGYELKGRSYSAPIAPPAVTITPSSPISQTPKRSDLDSIKCDITSKEMTDIYNPCEPTPFSTNLSSFWRPIRSKNSFSSQTDSDTSQIISTTMPPSILDLTPSSTSSASTPSSDLSSHSSDSFTQNLRRKPIAGRKKSCSTSNSICTPMPTTLFYLLTSIQLIQYLDLFESNAIDMYSFLTLTDDDFQVLGITSFGDRKKMSIAQLRYHESVDVRNTQETFLADYLLNERDILTKKVQALEEKIKYYEIEGN